MNIIKRIKVKKKIIAEMKDLNFSVKFEKKAYNEELLKLCIPGKGDAYMCGMHNGLYLQLDNERRFLNEIYNEL